MTGFLRACAPLLLLSACASLPAAAPPVTPASESFAFNGRIFLSGRNGALSGSIRWEHQAAGDMLMLSTPTGQGLARLSRTAEGAELAMPDGHYRAASSEELSARLFGAPLSLEALSHWVLGRPGHGTGAWSVDVLEPRNVNGRNLPARLLLRHAGAELRLAIDEWTVLP